ATAVLAGLYLLMWNDAMLPVYQERVRWFTDQVPDATPVDQPLLVRAHYLLRLVGDIRYTVPLLNALFPAALLWLVVAHWGARSAVPVSLGVLAVMGSYGAAYYSTSADAEVPAAVFGMVGLLAVSRGRLAIGGVWLWLALLLKSTALYFVASAAGLALWQHRMEIWRATRAAWLGGIRGGAMVAPAPEDPLLPSRWGVLTSPMSAAMAGFLVLYS